MNKKNDSVTRIRFPEFANSVISFINGDNVFKPVNNKSHNSDLSVLAITQEYGAIPREQIDYNVSVTDKSLAGYKVVEIGDFIISLRSFQGGIEYSLYRGICSPAYIILRKKVPIVDGYYKYYFKTSQYIRELNKNLEGIRDGKMVSYSQFSDIIIPKPDIREQQKIYDCLSSLDELITAEENKLESLKSHKKGLLQKMFPVEGETIPEVRFPGFNDAWELRAIGDVVDDYVEKTTVQNQYPVLTSSQQKGIVFQEDYFSERQITTNDNIGYFVLPKGYFTYRSRSDNGVFVFNRNALVDKGIISYFYPVFKPREVDSDFLLRRLNYGIERQTSLAAEGTGQRVLSLKKFKNIVTAFPLIDEQIKIGQLFTTIDNIITLYQRKVDFLQLHKKGLLQGLFPAIEEINK
jgi:type I restriction enzyme S subunit